MFLLLLLLLLLLLVVVVVVVVVSLSSSVITQLILFPTGEHPAAMQTGGARGRGPTLWPTLLPPLVVVAVSSARRR